VDVEEAGDVVHAVHEVVLDTRRHEEEGSRACDDLVALADEDELPLEHVERVVLVRVHVRPRPRPPRLHRDHGEVEARRVGRAGEELDVRHAVTRPRPDDDGTLTGHGPLPSRRC